jgi:lactose/raffinose/galactose permease
MKAVRQYLSYAAGSFGHDAFYATLSTYFMIFVTGALFDTGDKAFDAKMIGWVTTLIVTIRLVEIAFDPIIGGIVDNTRSRFGKFKPWLVVAGLISSVLLVVIFTDFGGLATSNPVLYIILFGIVFIILDAFYSFKDIAFWSMLPALTLDSSKREKFGTIARFGSTLGQQGVQIVVVPLVAFFSMAFVGVDGVTKTGWFWFAIVIAVVAYLGALITVVGTKEEDNVVRQNTEKVSVIDVFKVIGKNDQLMWQAISYIIFALSYVVTNSLLLYYFTYVLGMAQAFAIVGVMTTIEGMIAVVAFPVLTKFMQRRTIFVSGAFVMLLGYLVFLFGGQSLPVVLVAVTLFFMPYPIMFLVVLMTITDSVEYGQWKLGTRHESVTLAIRPLLDKLAGAFANGIVGFAAVGAGMIGNAKPSDISAAGLLTFKSFMFYGPMILIAISTLIYWKKVTLTEKRHDEIVAELEARLTEDSENL